MNPASADSTRIITVLKYCQCRRCRPRGPHQAAAVWRPTRKSTCEHATTGMSAPTPGCFPPPPKSRRGDESREDCLHDLCEMCARVCARGQSEEEENEQSPCGAVRYNSLAAVRYMFVVLLFDVNSFTVANPNNDKHHPARMYLMSQHAATSSGGHDVSPEHRHTHQCFGDNEEKNMSKSKPTDSDASGTKRKRRKKRPRRHASCVTAAVVSAQCKQPSSRLKSPFSRYTGQNPSWTPKMPETFLLHWRH